MHLKPTEFCKLFEDGSVKINFVNKKHQAGGVGAAYFPVTSEKRWG